MKLLVIALFVLLHGCGGGSGSEEDAGPTVCGKFYCDPQGRVVPIEHNSTNADHITQGRAVLEADGVAYVNLVPIGKPDEFTAVCEVAVGEFVAGTC